MRHQPDLQRVETTARFKTGECAKRRYDRRVCGYTGGGWGFRRCFTAASQLSRLGRAKGEGEMQDEGNDIFSRVWQQKHTLT